MRRKGENDNTPVAKKQKLNQNAMFLRLPQPVRVVLLQQVAATHSVGLAIMNLSKVAVDLNAALNQEPFWQLALFLDFGDFPQATLVTIRSGLVVSGATEAAGYKDLPSKHAWLAIRVAIRKLLQDPVLFRYLDRLTGNVDISLQVVMKSDTLQISGVYNAPFMQPQAFSLNVGYDVYDSSWRNLVEKAREPTDVAFFRATAGSFKNRVEAARGGRGSSYRASLTRMPKLTAVRVQYASRIRFKRLKYIPMDQWESLTRVEIERFFVPRYAPLIRTLGTVDGGYRVGSVILGRDIIIDTLYAALYDDVKEEARDRAYMWVKRRLNKLKDRTAQEVLTMYAAYATIPTDADGRFLIGSQHQDVCQ